MGKIKELDKALLKLIGEYEIDKIKDNMYAFLADYYIITLRRQDKVLKIICDDYVALIIDADKNYLQQTYDEIVQKINDDHGMDEALVGENVAPFFVAFHNFDPAPNKDVIPTTGKKGAPTASTPTNTSPGTRSPMDGMGIAAAKRGMQQYRDENQPTASTPTPSTQADTKTIVRKTNKPAPKKVVTSNTSKKAGTGSRRTSATPQSQRAQVGSDNGTKNVSAESQSIANVRKSTGVSKKKIIIISALGIFVLMQLASLAMLYSGSYLLILIVYAAFLVTGYIIARVAASAVVPHWMIIGWIWYSWGAIAIIVVFRYLDLWWVAEIVVAVSGILVMHAADEELSDGWRIFGIVLYAFAGISSAIVLFRIGLWWAAIIEIVAGIIIFSKVREWLVL